MWRRVGHRTGRKKAKVDKGARISDSGWGQGSHSVNQYLSQSVNQSVSGEQREEVQMQNGGGGKGQTTELSVFFLSLRDWRALALAQVHPTPSKRIVRAPSCKLT